MLRRIHKASVDMVLCAPNKKRKATEKLIAPTNQRLKGFRMQKKIRGPIPSQLHQRPPKTNDNECLLPPLPATVVSRGNRRLFIVKTTDRRSLMSISKISRGGDRRPSCSAQG